MGAPRKYPAGDSKASSGDSKSEAKKRYELAIASETVYSSPYVTSSLRIIPFSPDLIACYQTNSVAGSKLKIYRNGKVVSAFSESFQPQLVFSQTEGELVTISSDEAHRRKNFESKELVFDVLSEMKELRSECRGGSFIPAIEKPIHAAPDGTWYFSTMNPNLNRRELKQFDGKKIISIAKLPLLFDAMVWNQNNDIIGLSRTTLCKIKAGIVNQLHLNRDGAQSLTSLPDYLVAVHSDLGIEIINTKNEMKSVGKKELTNISKLLTNPNTGELIVVLYDGRINIFAVKKISEGQIEFIGTGRFDTKLPDICTAEWNPYTHSVLVMSKEGFKEIDLGYGKKIHEKINAYLIDSLAEITIEYLGFFKPPKPTSEADVEKPDPVPADWSDLGRRPKT